MVALAFEAVCMLVTMPPVLWCVMRASVLLSFLVFVCGGNTNRTVFRLGRAQRQLPVVGT